jgi:hypothetical protein
LEEGVNLEMRYEHMKFNQREIDTGMIQIPVQVDSNDGCNDNQRKQGAQATSDARIDGDQVLRSGVILE